MEKIKDTLHYIFRLIKQYKYTLLTLIFFYLIVSYPVGFYPRLVPTIGCLSMLLILNIIAKAKLSYLYATILIILTTLSAYISFTYSSYVSSSMIAVIFETNSDEIKSVFAQLFFSVFALLAISSFLIIFSVRELKKSNFNVKYSILYLLIFIGFLSAGTFRRILILTDLRAEYNKSPLDVFSNALNHYTPFFYGNIAIISSYFYDIYLFNEYKNAEKAIPWGVSSDEQKEEVSKIFLVIGESANATHLSILGYHKPTTPFLDSLSLANNKVFAYEGRAIASQTKNAVPGILTSNSPQDLKIYREEYSIIELAKMKGYSTYWISNQNTYGIWNGRDVISAIAGQADYKHFWDGKELSDDFNLFPLIEQYYEHNEQKQLFIIHLQGSHFMYKDRYDEIDAAQLPGEETLLMHYDRSIHHTDRFLKILYEYVEANPSSSMIYLSDHGQEIKEIFGHGVGEATKKKFHVPIVAINNSIVPVDSIMNKYLSPNDSILSNNSIPEIVSELMGYTISSQRVKESVRNGEYVLHGDNIVYKYSELK